MPDNATESATGFDFSDPGEGTSSGAANSAHVGCSMVYGYPTEDEKKGNSGTYAVAQCDFVVRITHHKAWEDLPVSGKALVPRLLSATTDLVLCKLVQGEAKENQSPPILPEPLDETEKAKAQDVFSRFAGKFPSGRVTFDVAAFNKAAPPEPSEEPFG